MLSPDLSPLPPVSALAQPLLRSLSLARLHARVRSCRPPLVSLPVCFCVVQDSPSHHCCAVSHAQRAFCAFCVHSQTFHPCCSFAHNSAETRSSVLRPPRPLPGTCPSRPSAAAVSLCPRRTLYSPLPGLQCSLCPPESILRKVSAPAKPDSVLLDIRRVSTSVEHPAALLASARRLRLYLLAVVLALSPDHQAREYPKRLSKAVTSVLRHPSQHPCPISCRALRASINNRVSMRALLACVLQE